MLRIFRGERRSDHAQPSADAEQSPDGSGQGDAPPASTVAERPERASPPAAANGSGNESAVGETPQQGAVEAPPQGAMPGEAPPQGAMPGEAPPSQLPADPGFLQRGRLRRRARFLRAARELAYRDLGGLVFDLHRFGQRNDEVVTAKLETLRRIDEELRALEDALKERSPITVLREVGVAACPRCAAIHGSGDRFCPACGMPVAPSERPIGGAPAQPPASPAVPQHALTPQQPVHAFQPPLPYQPPLPAPPITQPHVSAPPLPPTAPAASQLQPLPPQAPLPLPNAAAPAPAQQIGNGAYPALPAAPAAPTAPSPASASQTPSPAPANSAPESPTEVLSSHEQSTRAFEPVQPAPDDHGGSGSEERGER